MKKIVTTLFTGMAALLLFAACELPTDKSSAAGDDPPALSADKAITNFSFESITPAAHGIISGNQIAINVPSAADKTNLVASFTTTGISVAVNSVQQESGTTPNDCSSPVTYTVTAADGTTANYTVTVKTSQSSFSSGTDNELWYDAAAYTQTATGSEGSGTTTYSSDDISIATVNSSTGEVTITGTGSTSITASNPGDDTYGAAHDSYTLWVKAPFITTWETTSSNESITIPTTSSSHTYSVDWGDGTKSVNITGNGTNTYSSAGTHTVKISKDFFAIYLNNGTEKDKIMSIEQWGDIKWGTFQHAFYGCSNMITNAKDRPDLSSVADMSYMFAGSNSTSGSSKFNRDIGDWDVSNVTDMAYMFQYAVNFNQDISSWDVSHVTRMLGMFYYAKSFNQDLNDWNVSNVANFGSIFRQANNFNGNISNWDVSGATYTNSGGGVGLSQMFLNAKKFNQDIGGWQIPPEVTYLADMFLGATSFNQDLNSWDVSHVTVFRSMFDNATSFNGNISSWVVSSATDMNKMFYCANDFNGDVSSWNVVNVTKMDYMFQNAMAFLNHDLSNWDVSNVTTHINFNNNWGSGNTVPSFH